jgi:hypothetical protein
LPKAKEGKFDVDEYGEKLEKETSVAEKLHKLAEFGKSEKFGFIFKDSKWIPCQWSVPLLVTTGGVSVCSSRLVHLSGPAAP